MKKVFLIFLVFPVISFSQDIPLSHQTPPVGTSHAAMMNYFEKIVDNTSVEMEIAGKSVEAREIPVIFYPQRSEWNNNHSKIMLFAQQHGNEPSGKEALIMLVTQLTQGNPAYPLTDLNLILIPMVNPDGNELDQRRNASGVDLNRNHVILTEPETQVLHKIFNRYNPDVTLDIHEYGMKTWLKHGYIKNLGEQLDVVSNPAIPETIKTFSVKQILDPVLNATYDRGIRANRYLITRSDMDYFVRHSTTDINDGRNSFGIRYTLSFILEGLNGLSKSDRIWQRSQYQLTLIEEFLRICNSHSAQIVTLIKNVRNSYENNFPDSVMIHADYTADNSRPLEINLQRTSDLKDTLITLPDYRPTPQAVLKVKRFPAYIIKQPDSLLISLLNYKEIDYKILKTSVEYKVEEFQVTGEDTLRYEGRNTIIPAGSFFEKNYSFQKGDIFIPTTSICATQIVQIFEPRSFYGISHYPEFKHLWNLDNYPVFRVISEAEK